MSMALEKDKTPVKIYKDKYFADYCCRFCEFSFVEAKKKASFNIFGRNKEEFSRTFKRVTGHGIIKHPLLSSVLCKPFHSKIEKFEKVLCEIDDFKLRVNELRNAAVFADDGNAVASITGREDTETTRVKRCSKSPHQSGSEPKLILRPSNLKPRTIILPKKGNNSASSLDLCVGVENKENPEKTLSQLTIPNP